MDHSRKKVFQAVGRVSPLPSRTNTVKSCLDSIQVKVKDNALERHNRARNYILLMFERDIHRKFAYVSNLIGKLKIKSYTFFRYQIIIYTRTKSKVEYQQNDQKINVFILNKLFYYPVLYRRSSFIVK